MKLCINCKHYREDTVCVSPQIDNLVHPVTGEKIILQYKRCDFFRHTWYTCLDGKWYEEKEVKPVVPEGWRLLECGEMIQGGDKYYLHMSKEWLCCNRSIGQLVSEDQPYKVEYYIRKVVPTIAKCPYGHQAFVQETCSAYCVLCDGCAWRGPYKSTKEEAIEAWNSAMQK